MYQPLADQLRPQNLDEVFGQEHILGEGAVLRRLVDSGKVPNMIFYGPSGTGKTTVANIIAKQTNRALYQLNATTASTADIKNIVSQLDTFMAPNGVLLYLDEIQSFNKKQQQSLLEHIENGKITLIASTTENPYFYIYPAIISRCAVFEFKSIDSSALKQAVRRAANILKEESGRDVHFTEDALSMIVGAAAGDARRAVGLFENIASVYEEITEETVRSFLPEVMGMAGFDKSGDGHYDLLSALQKSIRGSDPDAALFYLAKLLSGGDLISVCRRLQVIANEDVGLAYPQAITVVRACVESARELGLPEARIPLANAAVILATAPKSNAVYLGIGAAMDAVAAGKGATFPRCLQNVHFDGENSAKKGQDYKYPHDYPNHYVSQQYLPDDLKNAKFYTYGDNKTEQAAKAYWDKIKK